MKRQDKTVNKLNRHSGSIRNIYIMHIGSGDCVETDYDDICLDIKLKLGKRIQDELPENRGAYTQTSDNCPEIHDRATFANSNKGDLFVSIHVNAAPPIRHNKFLRYRTQTYYSGKGASRKKRSRKVPV
jgi:N-acetylmuramoyl-L-alanine amidase